MFYFCVIICNQFMRIYLCIEETDKESIQKICSTSFLKGGQNSAISLNLVVAKTIFDVTSLRALFTSLHSVTKL
jgi:hypothetical protein